MKSPVFTICFNFKFPKHCLVGDELTPSAKTKYHLRPLAVFTFWTLIFIFFILEKTIFFQSHSCNVGKNTRSRP